MKTKRFINNNNLNCKNNSFVKETHYFSFGWKLNKGLEEIRILLSLMESLYINYILQQTILATNVLLQTSSGKPRLWLTASVSQFTLRFSAFLHFLKREGSKITYTHKGEQYRRLQIIAHCLKRQMSNRWIQIEYVRLSLEYTTYSREALRPLRKM